MTLPRTDWTKDTATPPRNNDEVTKIMQDKGVSRRGAYAIVRRRRAEEMYTEDVDRGQRMAVLTILTTKPETGKDARLILEALHDAGVGIDLHDVNKTLWALQKTSCVRFREKNNPRSLYAIRITETGVATLSDLKRANGDAIRAESKRLSEARLSKEAAVAEVPDFGVQVSTRSAPPPEVAPIVASDDDVVSKLGDLSSWPRFRDVRERAERAAKINAAAKLLEEAGEDEIALNLMGKTEFSPLEEEVRRLLEIAGK